MRRFTAVGLAILFSLAGATPAWAQDGGTTEDFVVLSGPANVPSGARVSDLVVFHGSSTVDGAVTGSVTAFDAPVTISGQVGGDVVVFNGRLVLRSGARVGGDVVTRTAPVVEPGATIGGERRRVQTNLEWDGFGWVGRFVLWLAISVSTLVVGLLFVLLLGRGAERLADAGRTSIGPAIGWGVLLFFGLPVLAIIALVTLVGLPLGLGLLFALGFSQRTRPARTAPPTTGPADRHPACEAQSKPGPAPPAVRPAPVRRTR